MAVQKCPMCLETKKVVRSHLHPSGVYALLRSSADDSPLRVGDDVIMLTDRQMQHPLLCEECEDILNKGGETWTIPKLATTKKTFPLYDILTEFPPETKPQAGAMYFAARNPKIDVEKLTHFGMGIFWKASIHSWKGKEKSPLIDLGPYSDTIRIWLRGEGGFPPNVCMSIMLSRPELALIALHGPVETPHKPWRIFVLYICGITFILNVGRLMDLDTRMGCFHGNPDHHVFVSDQVMGKIWEKLAIQFRESRKSNSYLEAKAKRLLKC
jgi:hypothetical protein